MTSSYRCGPFFVPNPRVHALGGFFLKSIQIIFTSTLFFGACAASKPSTSLCSSVKAIPVADSVLADELKNQRIVAGWGCILDLLEEPESPQTSKRNRCTFYPDYVPVAAGHQPNPAKLALWTADHCLDFTRAKCGRRR